jgi:hypothetical protein
MAAKVDHYGDYAHFCGDLHQSDQGRRYRELAGLHDHIPGQDDLCHFRYSVGDEVIHQTIAVVVGLLQTFGLIKGELLATDGQLEPSYSRYKGCPYACQGCHAFRVDEVGQQKLRRQLQSGAKRLQLTCPFPEVVDKVRQATAKKGNPKDPKVSLLEIEDVPDAALSNSDPQRVATLLGLSEDKVPPLRLTWCHLHQTSQGELVGSCPKVPSDLERVFPAHFGERRTISEGY